VRVCSIDECENNAIARGWCSKHWVRWRNHGDPVGLKTNSAPSDWERFWAKVDKENADGCWLWTGTLNDGGYGQFAPTFGRNTKAHRYCYAEFIGPIPDDKPIIDHKCRVRSCVNPEHLRAVSHAENSQNLTPRRGTESGCRGVTQDKRTGKWFGRVVTRGRQFNTARFNTIEEADHAVRYLRSQLFTHSDEQPGSGDQLRQLVREKVSKS
jgi:hypothetical protein